MIRIAIGMLLSGLAVNVQAAELHGVVIGVTDGDTVTVLDGNRKQHKIRLAGIDAPEKDQGYAERSKQHLANLAWKKQATLDCYKTDQYKRKVCRVWVSGTDIALAQVHVGLAWHFKKFENEQTPTERASYTQAENDARASRIGLWQSNRAIPPWEFRRQKKK